MNTTWAVAAAAALLAVVTVIGVVTTVGDNGTNRVAPSSTAPVYGTP